MKKKQRGKEIKADRGRQNFRKSISVQNYKVIYGNLDNICIYIYKYINVCLYILYIYYIKRIWTKKKKEKEIIVYEIEMFEGVRLTW